MPVCHPPLNHLGVGDMSLPPYYGSLLPRASKEPRPQGPPSPGSRYKNHITCLNIYVFSDDGDGDIENESGSENEEDDEKKVEKQQGCI